jgi:DNA-binding transcriptional LysR family regulator
MSAKMIHDRSSEWMPTEHAIPGIDLNLLMLFLEIVNAKSISQTAVRLQIPKATLSRKLRQLEQQVGAVLLKRGPRSLEMTEIGAALYHHCERIAAEAHDASLIASEMQSQVRGAMRVSVPFGIGHTWVSAALARFALMYPDVKLNVHVTNQWVDVSEERYDVAIHIGRIRNEHLPTRRLAELPRGCYCSPAYLEAKGMPRSPADLLKHDCIVLQSQLDDGLWTFNGENGRPTAVLPRMTVTDVVIAHEMATSGVGCTVLTHALCEADVQARRLVRVLPQWNIPPVLIAATFLERRHVPLRIRAFLDLVGEQMRYRSLPLS